MKTIKRITAAVAALALAGVVAGCAQRPAATLSDEALLDSVERRTFDYFWSGAEPNSGLACERINMDGIYPENDETVVTTGGSGFGILALIAGMERGYVTREQGIERFERIVSFLERADRFHGAWPHWIEGRTGRVKPFGKKDNGGDLVETAFLVQGLLAAHQYFAQGNEREQALAQRIDTLWRGVEWSWYRNGQNVLYWHWSPEYGWEMNFAVHGFNECLVMYILAAASPTYPIDREVYTEGWAENGAIVDEHEVEGYRLRLRYQGVEAGPLFWAHYSFLGLDPRGLRDDYCEDYFGEMRNYSLINRAYCIRNPRHYKGYGKDCWGLTASYSTAGDAAHAPVEREDRHRAGQGEHPGEFRARVRVVEVDRVLQHDGGLRNVDSELVHRAAYGGSDLVGELGGQAVGGDGGLAGVVLGREQVEVGELAVAVGVGRARHRGGLVDIPEHHGRGPPYSFGAVWFADAAMTALVAAAALAERARSVGVTGFSTTPSAMCARHSATVSSLISSNEYSSSAGQSARLST